MPLSRSSDSQGPRVSVCLRQTEGQQAGLPGLPCPLPPSGCDTRRWTVPRSTVLGVAKRGARWPSGAQGEEPCSVAPGRPDEAWGQRRSPPANGQQSRQRPPREKVPLLVGSAAAESIQKAGEAKRSLQNMHPLKVCIPFKCVGKTLPWEFRGRGAEGPLFCPSPQDPDTGQTFLRTNPLGVQRAPLDRCQAI